jgi:hypothetical protein
MLENVNGIPRITCARFAYGCGVNSAAVAAGSLAVLQEAPATASAMTTMTVLIRPSGIAIVDPLQGRR